jgi:hypothetical protein
MKIKYKEVSDYIPKSTGYMLTLMRGQDLPLVRFTRGKRVVYTTIPFGPHADSVYDWDRSSPVKFTERQVQKALDACLVVLENNKVFLTNAGYMLSRPCADLWGPILDEYFRNQGYNIEWRTWRD